jgi:hypothetical protein
MNTNKLKYNKKNNKKYNHGAAVAAAPQAVELDYGTQMKNLSSEETWPNSLKQNK